jgi:hypothetical protein
MLQFHSYDTLQKPYLVVLASVNPLVAHLTFVAMLSDGRDGSSAARALRANTMYPD